MPLVIRPHSLRERLLVRGSDYNGRTEEGNTVHTLADPVALAAEGIRGNIEASPGQGSKVQSN